MWDLSALTRDRTHAPCSGSTESQLLDHQGSPGMKTFRTYSLGMKTFRTYSLSIFQMYD